jgi:hypothetical protein
MCVKINYIRDGSPVTVEYNHAVPYKSYFRYISLTIKAKFAPRLDVEFAGIIFIQKSSTNCLLLAILETD